MPHPIRSKSSKSAVLCLFALAIAAMFIAALGGPAALSASPQSDTQRTVFITGANRGIGLEFARQYAADGWNVIATARKPDEADDLKALGKNVRILALDVTSDDSVAAVAKALSGQPIDVLINNAGIGLGASKLEDIKIGDYVNVLEVNLVGPVRVTQALLGNLRAGTGKTIVSISSGLGSISNNSRGNYHGYRESKAALNMFMRTLAAELKDDGFVCIAMSPGWVQTDMGGPDAHLTPQESITGMRSVIDNLKPEHSGTFQNHDGSTLPW